MNYFNHKDWNLLIRKRFVNLTIFALKSICKGNEGILMTIIW
jgi:hypothetical protein